MMKDELEKLQTIVQQGFKKCNDENDVCSKYYNKNKNLILWVDSEEENEYSELPKFTLQQADEERFCTDVILLTTDCYKEIIDYLNNLKN